MDKLENRHNWDFLPRYQMHAYNGYLAIINIRGFSYSWWYWKSLTYSYFKFCCTLSRGKWAMQPGKKHSSSPSICTSIRFCSEFLLGSSQGLNTMLIFENQLHSKNQTDNSKEKIEERVNKSLSEMALYWEAGYLFHGDFSFFLWTLKLFLWNSGISKCVQIISWYVKDLQYKKHFLMCQSSSIPKGKWSNWLKQEYDSTHPRDEWGIPWSPLLLLSTQLCFGNFFFLEKKS